MGWGWQRIRSLQDVECMYLRRAVGICRVSSDPIRTKELYSFAILRELQVVPGFAKPSFGARAGVKLRKERLEH